MIKLVECVLVEDAEIYTEGEERTTEMWNKKLLSKKNVINLKWESNKASRKI